MSPILMYILGSFLPYSSSFSYVARASLNLPFEKNDSALSLAAAIIPASRLIRT